MSENNTKPVAHIVPLRSGGRALAIIPQTFEEVQRIAVMAVKAGLGANSFRDSPETAIAKATAIIMHGQELGLSPMQALAGIAIINGKPTIYGDLMTAVLWANGFKVKKWIEGEGDARVARARITRPDGEVIEDKFTVAQAKQARLWDTRETIKKRGKDGEYTAQNDSAWFRFADDMLGWKALGRAVRTGASDATRGLVIREDIEPEMVDITPAAAPAAGMATPATDEIPEIPADTIRPTAAQVAEPAEDPVITDVEGVLAKLRDELLGEKDEAIRSEIWDANSNLIERLPDGDQRRAQAIFDGREPRA